MTVHRRAIVVSAALLTATALPGSVRVASAAAEAPSGAWVTGYYPSSELSHLPPDKIDFRAITHLVYLALLPNADGSLDDQTEQFASGAIAARDAAHKAGKKVLVCIGGSETGKRFVPAIHGDARAALIRNLVHWTTTNGYDGVDIDMEPVEPANAEDFQAFIRELRAGLRAADPKMLLTCAAQDFSPNVYLPIQDQFDQINIMTYAWVGDYFGTTWYDAALYNRKNIPYVGNGAPATDPKGPPPPLPSVDYYIKDWLSRGFTPGRIGIGTAFYAPIWHGATGPGQPLTGVKLGGEQSYAELMQRHYPKEAFHWDDDAHAPYVSLTAPEKMFIVYDDERVCREKIDFLHKNHLGGIIIWEIGQDYRPDQPAGKQHPLLQAIYEAKP